MKHALVTILSAAALLVLTSCGGGSSSSSNNSSGTQTSGIKKRALVTDRFNGDAVIIDAATDVFRGHTISTGAGSSVMMLMPDKLHTIVLASGLNQIISVDNTTEAVVQAFAMPDQVQSIVVAPDNKTVYAAVRNAPVLGQLSGMVEIIDITNTSGALAGNVQVPTVRYLSLSHNGSTLLAFSDNSNQVAVINTSTKAVTFVGGFDHPVGGVFSSDDNTAYILSCGKECGGTTTKVNALTIASNAVGPDVPVEGATTALLDSGNLYVAGNNLGNGRLNVITTSSMTVSKTGVAIANGYHSKMALAGGQLFIGSTGCDNITSGCLSLYNVSSGSVVNSPAGAGDTTGIEPITGRTVVYVIEGGELVIWDTTTVAPIAASKQIDIVGQAYDAKLID